MMKFDIIGTQYKKEAVYERLTYAPWEQSVSWAKKYKPNLKTWKKVNYYILVYSDSNIKLKNYVKVIA